MADFDLNQVNMLAGELGASPEFVRQQLQLEGHNVVDTMPAVPAPPMARVPAPAAPQSLPSQPVGAYAPGPTQVPAPPPDEFERMLVEQSNQATKRAGVGILELGTARTQGAVTPPGAAAPDVQMPRAGGGVRARGLWQPTQQAPQVGEGYGRARRLLDQRQRQLEGEYDEAARQYEQSARRLGELQDEQLGFAQQKANIDAAYAAKRADVLNRQAEADAIAMAEEQKARAKEDEMLAAREERLRRERDEWANMKVTGPGLGQRLSNAIALALATYGDALSGIGGIDTNYTQATASIINAAIDRDISEKLRRIDAKGANLDAEEQAIQRLRAQFADDRAFRDYMRGANREAMARKVEALAAQSDNETAAVAAQALATDWKAQAEAETKAALAANTEEARKRLRSAADERFAFELGVAMPKGGAGAQEVMPGAGGLIQLGDATAEDRKKAQEIASKFNGVLATIADLKDAARRFPSGTLSATDRNYVALLLENYMGQNSQAFGKGTPQEAEAQRQLERLSDPTAVFTTSDAARLYQMLEASTKRNADAQMRPYNFTMAPEAVDFQPE